MQVLRVFPGGLISRFEDVIRPSRSSDHALPDYFLWGYAKHDANIADLTFWRRKYFF